MLTELDDLFALTGCHWWVGVDADYELLCRKEVDLTDEDLWVAACARLEAPRG